jgi:hypothetical protein
LALTFLLFFSTKGNGLDKHIVQPVDLLVVQVKRRAGGEPVPTAYHGAHQQSSK